MHAVIKFIAYAWFQYVCHTKWCDVMWRRPLNKPLIILNGSIQLRSKWIWNTLQNKKIRTRNCPNQLNYVTLDSTISQLVQVQLPLWINYIWVNSKWMNNFFFNDYCVMNMAEKECGASAIDRSWWLAKKVFTINNTSLNSILS